MKSIKPGRGPSAFSAVGGVFVALFGVFWTITAVSMGAPGIFALFGVAFVVIALGGVAYNYNNATSKNRMSVYDITEDNEEPDPLQEHFAGKAADKPQDKNRQGANDLEKFNYDTKGFDKLSYGIEMQEDAHENVDKLPVYEAGEANTKNESINFCPYCRYEIKGDFVYCPKCGKDISKA